MDAPIDFSTDGPIATLTLNRPDKRNAIALAQWLAIPDLVARACAAPATRVIVLCGAGGNFAAGADIGEFGGVFRDRATTKAYLASMSAATRAIEAAALPVIARIDGLCIGAAVALAAACDLRLVASDARFAITPAKLGLIYSLADTARVMALVGPGVTKDLLFTGRMIDAAEAHAVGLVNSVHAPGDLAAAVHAKAMAVAANSAWSHARGKQVVQRILAGARDDDDETAGWFADAPQGADFREGIAAFTERRKPDFRA
jgi:enoyl-CoA hydratase/carnithine racemase